MTKPLLSSSTVKKCIFHQIYQALKNPGNKFYYQDSIKVTQLFATMCEGWMYKFSEQAYLNNTKRIPTKEVLPLAYLLENLHPEVNFSELVSDAEGALRYIGSEFSESQQFIIKAILFNWDRNWHELNIHRKDLFTSWWSLWLWESSRLSGLEILQ